MTRHQLNKIKIRYKCIPITIFYWSIEHQNIVQVTSNHFEPNEFCDLCMPIHIATCKCVDDKNFRLDAFRCRTVSFERLKQHILNCFSKNSKHNNAISKSGHFVEESRLDLQFDSFAFIGEQIELKSCQISDESCCESKCSIKLMSNSSFQNLTEEEKKQNKFIVFRDDSERSFEEKDDVLLIPNDIMIISDVSRNEDFELSTQSLEKKKFELSSKAIDKIVKSNTVNFSIDDTTNCELIHQSTKVIDDDTDKDVTFYNFRSSLKRKASLEVISTKRKTKRNLNIDHYDSMYESNDSNDSSQSNDDLHITMSEKNNSLQVELSKSFNDTENSVVSTSDLENSILQLYDCITRDSCPEIDELRVQQEPTTIDDEPYEDFMLEIDDIIFSDSITNEGIVKNDHTNEEFNSKPEMENTDILNILMESFDSGLISDVNLDDLISDLLTD